MPKRERVAISILAVAGVLALGIGLWRLNYNIKVPFLIKPVMYKGQFYIDGGLLDNLPLSQVPDTSESLAFDLEPVSEVETNCSLFSIFAYLMNCVVGDRHVWKLLLLLL